MKPAHAVREGDTVRCASMGSMLRMSRCSAISDRRGSATDAAALLIANPPASVLAREEEQARRRAAAATQPRSAGRPTKRERRKLEDFLNEP